MAAGDVAGLGDRAAEKKKDVPASEPGVNQNFQHRETGTRSFQIENPERSSGKAEPQVQAAQQPTGPQAVPDPVTTDQHKPQGPITNENEYRTNNQDEKQKGPVNEEEIAQARTSSQKDPVSTPHSKEGQAEEIRYVQSGVGSNSEIENLQQQLEEKDRQLIPETQSAGARESVLMDRGDEAVSRHVEDVGREPIGSEPVVRTAESESPVNTETQTVETPVPAAEVQATAPEPIPEPMPAPEPEIIREEQPQEDGFFGNRSTQKKGPTVVYNIDEEPSRPTGPVPGGPLGRGRR